MHFPVPAVVYMSPLSFRMRASTGNAVIDMAVPIKTKKLMKLTLAYFGSFFCIKRSGVLSKVSKGDVANIMGLLLNFVKDCDL